MKKALFAVTILFGVIGVGFLFLAIYHLYLYEPSAAMDALLPGMVSLFVAQMVNVLSWEFVKP